MEVLNNIDITPYGSSHSDVIGFKMRGIPAGYPIDFKQIDELLIKRKGSHKYNTTRSEVELLNVRSGFANSSTTGEEIWIEIEQNKFKKSDYEFGIVRPGHVDLSAYQKYGEDWDFSGGGQFSGRLTVLYVIAGEIARQVLAKLTSLKVQGHVKQVGNITDKFLSLVDLDAVQSDPFPMVDTDAKNKALNLLSELKTKGDSIGGKLDLYVSGLERNYGDDFFGGLESKIAFLLYSIPAVKAVEFGIGVEFSNKCGSEVVEELTIIDGKVNCETNYNGGISGGIANLSSPIKLSLTIKPTSTIFQEVKTVKFDGSKFEPATLKMSGRHDAFIANRALWPAIGLLNILFLDMELCYVR